MPHAGADDHQAVIETSDAGKLPAQPIVSVVMLAYRHENFLADAIEGVLLQRTDFPVELIIAEDCSPDATLAIAKRYQREHPELIRIITSSGNVGAKENGARAIAACRGVFIAMCEGDDYWHHPAKLQMQVDVLQAQPHVGFVHTEYDRRVGNLVGSSDLSNSPPVASPGAFAKLLHGNDIGTATTVFRADAVRASHAFSRHGASYLFGDYDRMLFVAQHWDVAYIPSSTTTYRHVRGSAMNSGWRQRLALRQSVIQCRKDYMTRSGYTFDDLTQIEVAEHALLYADAYLAGDSEIFDSVTAWRSEHDPVWHAGWRHASRRLIIRSAPLHAFIAWRARQQWRRTIARQYSQMTIPEQRRAALDTLTP